MLFREELTGYILEHLSAGANRDDIIRYVCERGQVSWPEAAAFVADVESSNERTILRRQSPINLTTAFMFSLAGMLLTGVAVYLLFAPVLMERRFTWNYLFYTIRGGYQIGFLLLAGLAMAIGGLIQMFGTLFDITRK
jgi:hypothetical protein